MFPNCACRGRRGSYPPPPRTDPGVRYYRTGLFRQPRFRNTPNKLASMLFPAVRFTLLIRLCMSGQGFLYGLRMPVSPFPTWTALPSQSTMGWSDSRRVFGFPTTSRFVSAYLLLGQWWSTTQYTFPQQEPCGSPKFLTSLSTHATLFLDPGRPSENSPFRSLCIGFWHRYTIAICFILSNEAVSRLQGVRSPLWPMWFPVYASAISFGSSPPP